MRVVCTRCGDFLRAEDGSAGLCAACRAREKTPSVPFDDSSRPRVARYLATLPRVLFQPTSAFAATRDEPQRALLFGVPGGLVGTGVLAALVGPELLVVNPFRLPTGALHGAAWLILLACTGALLGATALIQHVLVLLAGGREGFARTLTVAFYVAGAASWVVAIPGAVGIPLGFVLYHFATAAGLAAAHRVRAGGLLLVFGLPLSGLAGVLIAIAVAVLWK